LKELKMCLNELSIIDDTLEALGVSKKYQRLHNWIIRIIIGWIIYFYYGLAISIYKVYFIKMYSKERFYLQFVNNFLIDVYILSALIFGIVLGYTSSRFHQVNDRLHVLYSDIFDNGDYKKQNRSILICERITGAKDRKQYIWIIM
ncbi:hypothetical protein ALC53_13600, partial [Atta colombica]